MNPTDTAGSIVRLAEEHGPFDVIYVDPPWWYANQTQHGGAGKPYTSGAESVYAKDPTTGRGTMTEEELCALPIRLLAARTGCVLFGWTTGPQQEIAMRVWRAWGFPYKTMAFVWNKCQVNPGAYTMSQTEFVHVGTRGRIPQPRGARNVRQWFEALETSAPLDPIEVLTAARGRHSEKPHEIRERIAEMFPAARKVELFARQTAPGWVSWGLEVPGVPEAA